MILSTPQNLCILINFLPLKAINESFAPNLDEAISRVVRSGWYLHGKETEAFEAEFAAFIGRRYCVGVANGLDALTLSLMTLKAERGWADGAEVIVPDMTFVATAEAVVRAGLKPVLADVNEEALLTAETAGRVLTERTVCVLPVHLYGHCAPMEQLLPWAAAHSLDVLEDAAQAHGAACGGKRAGSWGALAAFSFYPGKNLGALGDGGAVVTDSADLAQSVRTLANYGADKKYHHIALGLNSRLDEMQAAALRVKLPRLDEDNRRRQHIAEIFAQLIHNPAVTLPYEGRTAESIFHIYPLRCPTRHALQRHLERRGVETLIHYPLSLSQQPAFAALSAQQHPHTPVSQAWAAEELSLPIHPLLTDDEAKRICEAVNSFKP